MLAALTNVLDGVGDPPSADRLSAGITQFLSSTTAAGLPEALQPLWREIAAMLKADPRKPLPQRALDAISSWPAERVDRLVAKFRQLRGVLERLENERLEDEIRDKIRRHYL